MNGILTSIGNMFNSICGNSQWAKLWLGASALLTAYLVPIVGLLIACFSFTAVDMIYGIKRAKKLGEKITSKKNWQGTLCKIKDEFTILLLAHMLEYVILNDQMPFVLTGGVTVVICITELWSILENLNTIDPDGPWKLLGKFLKKKGGEYVGLNLTELKNDTSDTDVDDKPQKDRRRHDSEPLYGDFDCVGDNSSQSE